MVQGVCAKGIFGPVDGAFTGRFDLIKVFEKAEPLFQRTVAKGDFKGAHRGASFVGAEDPNAKRAAGVVDK